MEVSGRTGSSDHVISCQPCQGDGDTIQAEGYCENCYQFICSTCIKSHRRLPLTKNHVIKSKDEMPTHLVSQSDPCTELCEIHRNEIIKFYCKEHDNVGCGDCMVLEHKPCKVQLVSDVSCNYDDSNELVLINHRINHIHKNLKSCKREIDFSLKTADEMKSDIIKEIKQFRKEMDAYLDNVTKDLIQEVEKMNTSDVSRQRKLQDQCKATIKDVEEIQKKLEQCKDNVNDLFVSSKRVHNKLQKCQEMNKEISAKSQINMVKFTPTADLHALKVQNTRLGNLDTQVKKFSGQCEKSIIDKKTNFVQKFNMKGRGENDCFITGMTSISENEILCADIINCSLKVFNFKESNITSTLTTSCCPHDVTTINSSSAAATLYDEGKLLLLNTKNGLSISHSIKVRKKCYGIDHHNGIMAVTFLEPPAVQVIDMEGHVLNEVSDTSILKEPQFVCLNNDNESMFVSDLVNSALFEFTLRGHLKNTIKSDEMIAPASVSITSCGSVVVCDSNESDKVGIIIPGTREILPLYLLDVQKPYSIVICEKQRKMFIDEFYTSGGTSYIKMFDLK